MEYQNDQQIEEKWWSYSYFKFVRDNPTRARSVESLLQYSGFFAPARLADRDLAIESGYAAARLAALGHDRILLQDHLGGVDQMHSLGSAPGSSVQLDPKRRHMSVDVFSDQMRVALAVIAHVQIVVEKLAGYHGGERRRQQAITYIETLKAISRLLLLACTKDMVIGGGVYLPGKRRSPRRQAWSKPGPSREVGLGGSFFGPESDVALVAPPSLPHTPDVYTGRRSGVRLIVPPRASVVWSGRGRSSRVGASRTVTPCDDSCLQRRVDGACSACEDIFDVSGGREPGFSQAWLMAGEVVHILRPLVYSYSCNLSGERSWRPWLSSLGMDAVGYACTSRAGGGKVALLLPIGNDPRYSEVPVLPFLDGNQVAELKRRKMQWFLYLMRSPAFELLAEPVSRSAAGVFEGVPLLGNLAGYALNMLLYIQRHHFYTSAS